MTRLVPVFIDVLLPVCLVVAIGYTARLRLKLDPRPLTRLALYVLNPCLVFSYLVHSEVSMANGVQMAVFATGTMLAAGLLGMIWALLQGADRASRSAQVLVSMFPNAGNLGLAVVGLAFGEPGVERAVIYFVASTILTNSLGVYIAANSSSGRLRALRKVLTMPQVYAVAAAIVVRMLGLPAESGGVLGSIFNATDLIAGATIPILLLALGMQLTEVTGGLRAISPAVGIGVGTRLLLSAPIAYGLARLMRLDDLSMRVGILEASMPAAVYTVILANEFDAQPRFVTTVVVVSTIASMVTLTVLLSLLV